MRYSYLHELSVRGIMGIPSGRGRSTAAAPWDAVAKIWSNDPSSPANIPICNLTLGMCINERPVLMGDVVHVDHGVQFMHVESTAKVGRTGIATSFGFVCDALGNPMIPLFRSFLEYGLLERKRRATWIDDSHAMFNYMEALRNRQSWRSRLRYAFPIK